MVKTLKKVVAGNGFNLRLVVDLGRIQDWFSRISEISLKTLEVMFSKTYFLKSPGEHALGPLHKGDNSPNPPCLILDPSQVDHMV